MPPAYLACIVNKQSTGMFERSVSCLVVTAYACYENGTTGLLCAALRCTVLIFVQIQFYVVKN